MNSPQLDQLCVNSIRILAMDAVQKANIGHPGMPMGAAAMAYVLWTRFMRHNPRNPHWPDRDRFVLSAGHGSMLLYSLLYLSGYDLSLQDLKQFRQWESSTPGHPEFGLTKGVETTTGPLGQGFANGVGMAMAAKHAAAIYNREGCAIIDHTIFGIVSDGDLMEGISHEAASLAGHLKLNNLVYLYDDNHITIDGSTALSFTEDVLRRFHAYGWHTQRVLEGNDMEAVAKAIAAARAHQKSPALIAVRTHIGYGSPHKQDTAEAHGAPLGHEEVALTKQALGWPTLEPFSIPPPVLDHCRKALADGQALEEEWKRRFEQYRSAHPQLAAQFEEAMRKQLPAGWPQRLPAFGSGDKPMATRKASGLVLNAVAPALPLLIGGSADLAESNNTYLSCSGDFAADDYAQRNIRFGVREHAMGAILNGMALHGGVIPYGGTFLVFSDYMRPALRLAAMMKQHVVFVFTHDSIGLGEDGPTHQPVEHLMSLRLIPNLVVLRPADSEETSAAWKVALERREGPVALVLTRQSVPALPRAKLSAREGVAKGGYVLAETTGRGPDVILIGTGSEMQWAFQAQQRLALEGVAARAVSMPSWELFESQPRQYRDEVLPPGAWRRVSIEAGATLGWERYVGMLGKKIGLDRFGASAPGSQLMDKFGFNAENVLAHARRLLGS